MLIRSFPQRRNGAAAQRYSYAFVGLMTNKHLSTTFQLKSWIASAVRAVGDNLPLPAGRHQKRREHSDADFKKDNLRMDYRLLAND
jgi:hypothetical protein